MIQKTFYTSKKQSIKLLLGSILFVTGGIFMFLNANTSSTKYNPTFLKIIGIIIILFFGLGIYISIRQLFKNKLLLILDNDGITFNPKTNKEMRVDWDSITGFSVIKIHQQKIILIKVNDSQHWIEKEQNLIVKELMKYNFNNYGTPFNFSANQLELKTEQLITLFKKYLKANKVK